jgi:hypothetical protein
VAGKPVCLLRRAGSGAADRTAQLLHRRSNRHEKGGGAAREVCWPCVRATVLRVGQHARTWCQTHCLRLHLMHHSWPATLSAQQTHIVEVAGSAPLPGCWGAGSADWTAEGYQGDLGRALCIARAVGRLQARRQKHRRVQGQSSQLPCQQVSDRAPKELTACGTKGLHDQHLFLASAAPAATYWRVSCWRGACGACLLRRAARRAPIVEGTPNVHLWCKNSCAKGQHSSQLQTGQSTRCTGGSSEAYVQCNRVKTIPGLHWPGRSKPPCKTLAV